MAVFYIDVSSFQAGINLSGWHAVAVKATQGTGYTDSWWGNFRTHAASVGAFFFGYHFLEHGNGAGQADHYFAVAGKTPCMIDFEPTTGSNPNLADCEQFCDRLRARGGVCNLVYLPRWYWGNLGQPSLQGLSNRHLHLVSSQYTGYSDSGPGWTPYGGMVPAIWQYTSTLSTGGFRQVDCNAYKGTFAQLQGLVAGTTPAPPAPAPPHPAPPPGMVVVPDVRGKTAGNAHNALVNGHLVPTAPGGQQASQICTGTSPVGGTDLKPSSSVGIAASAAPVLQMNASGSWTVLCQIDLNRANAGLKTDGSFGPATLAAVEHFQGNHGLSKDGIVGPNTWAKLGSL
jgi:GH25 family lysozyme M1 (1,4-beta-N-acetylmuramidase)